MAGSEARAVGQHKGGMVSNALTTSEVCGQVALIQEVMKAAMKKDEHYGVIPGTGTKPTLLKAGAEKLCFTFRLDAQFESENFYDGEHLTVKSKCVLTHIPTGQRVGSGEGMCSTRESKYAYRTKARRCPSCKAEAIIKGKAEYGGGWVCWKKKDGCGTSYAEDAKEITSQETGRVPNEDLADQYNTVLKMSNKRALVAATLVTTAASDCFTQDIEDMKEFIKEDNPPPRRPGPSGGGGYHPEDAPPPPADVDPGTGEAVPPDAGKPAKAKAAAKKKAAKKADGKPKEYPANSMQKRVKVLDVTTRTGKNKNGDWTLYRVYCESDGGKAGVSTFSDTIGGTAQTVMGKDMWCIAVIVEKPYQQGGETKMGYEFVDLTIEGQAPEPAPEPQGDRL